MSIIVSTGAKVFPSIVAKLNSGVVEALKSPEVVQRLAADGATAVGSIPEQFGAHIRSEMVKGRKVVNEIGLVLN